MGRSLDGRKKLGGLEGREEFYVTDINGVSYVATTQEVSALGGGSSTTSKTIIADFNLQGGSSTISNVAVYQKFYTPDTLSLNTVRFMVNGSTTTNLITVKFYDATGAELVGVEGTLIPTIDATIHTIDVTLDSTLEVLTCDFYWIGIHQITGGGASFVSYTASRGNTDWNTFVAGSALASSVPTGTATTARVCAELL